MKIENILIATNNQGKFTEISALLKQNHINSVSTFDLNIDEPEETGKTFAANSLLKAKYYSSKTNLISLADDSGLCVVDLDNKPGIHSARFAINQKTNQKDFPLAFEKIFSELDLKNKELLHKPKAFFVCDLALFDPKTNFSINFQGRIDGHLVFPPRGLNGFGYDPIFIKDGMDQTFGEIDADLKEKISHRAIAFQKLIDWLGKKNH
jgi:XTP/dITP diphosphohydrolase